MRTSKILVPIAAAFLAMGSAAQAQTTIEQLRSRQTQSLGRLEINLTLGEAMVMQGSQINNQVRQLNSQRDAVNREVEQHRGYCNGSFAQPEYERRVAQCNPWRAGLTARQNDITNEFETRRRQFDDLQRRNQERASDAGQIAQDFLDAMRQWNDMCLQLPPPVRARECRPLQPVGPRSAAFLSQAQAAFEAIESQCANLRRDRMVECERQMFDGNVYYPNRQEIADPFPQ